jgi:hypothetical protein
MRAGYWQSIDLRAFALAALLLCNGAALAQAGGAIPEATLREPWEQQLAVLQSLSGSITGVADPQTRAGLADKLAVLQVALGEYESQVDKVIDRIVGDPQFSYIAAETSKGLGDKLAEIHAGFDALYTSLGVQAREDVRAAQASLSELQRILQAKNAFERDVIRVVGSLSRDQIVEFGTRWWNGEERAIALKKFVADLRRQFEGLPVDKEQG